MLDQNHANESRRTLLGNIEERRSDICAKTFQNTTDAENQLSTQ